MIHKYWCKACGDRIALGDNGCCAKDACLILARVRAGAGTVFTKEALLAELDKLIALDPTNLGRCEMRLAVRRHPWDADPAFYEDAWESVTRPETQKPRAWEHSHSLPVGPSLTQDGPADLYIMNEVPRSGSELEALVAADAARKTHLAAMKPAGDACYYLGKVSFTAPCWHPMALAKNTGGWFLYGLSHIETIRRAACVVEGAAFESCRVLTSENMATFRGFMLDLVAGRRFTLMRPIRIVTVAEVAWVEPDAPFRARIVARLKEEERTKWHLSSRSGDSQ